jgi:glycosyltransferase involved in cell wall biosynthesis
MKILVSSSGAFGKEYGGGQVNVRNLVTELSRRGHEVTVFSCVTAEEGQDPGTTETRTGNVVVREVRIKHVRAGVTPVELTPESLEVVREAVAGVSPDVVHANGWKATFAKVCDELGVACVITAHHGGLVCPAGALLDANDGICQKPVGEHCTLCCQRQLLLGVITGAIVHAMPKPARLRLGKMMAALPFVPFVTGPMTVPLGVARRLEIIEAIVRSRAILVAPSMAIQAALIRNGIAPERTEVVHHGIEPFAKLPLQAGLGRRPLRLAYVGRLNRVKGVHVLVDAIRQLRDPACVELHLLGAAHTRPEKRYARRVIRAIPSGCRVVDHGQLDRLGVARELAGCDVLVLPSIYLEVFGLVIPEAFSLGRPVIVSRCGGPEEIVRDGVDGLVVERNNPQALAAAIQSLIDNPSRIEAMTANIRQVRTMEDNVVDLERVYQRAIGLSRGANIQ